jgi:hypothetical protein
MRSAEWARHRHVAQELRTFRPTATQCWQVFKDGGIGRPLDFQHLSRRAHLRKEEMQQIIATTLQNLKLYKRF